MPNLMQFLSRTLLAIAIGGCLAGIAGQSPGRTEPIPGRISKRFQLSVKVDPTEVKAGLPVMVKVTIRNVSSKVGRIPETLDDWDYEFTVIESSGKDVTRTEYGRQVAERERGGRRIDLEIRPTDEVRKTFDLGRFYVLNEPGRYYVRVTRIVVPDTGTTPERAVSSFVGFSISPE